MRTDKKKPVGSGMGYDRLIWDVINVVGVTTYDYK